MAFASVYPHYITKAEKKGRTKEEVHAIIHWLTGYDEQTLQQQIDKKVDFETYRSAKFPEALFNGHLTVANSDIRAIGNTQKHLQRWQGLTDWWQSLFRFAEEVEASENSTTKGR
jgi:hypothetical protein